MALLGWVPATGPADATALLPDAAQPRFVHNASGRFESRWVTVGIQEDTPAGGWVLPRSLAEWACATPASVLLANIGPRCLFCPTPHLAPTQANPHSHSHQKQAAAGKILARVLPFFAPSQVPTPRLRGFRCRPAPHPTPASPLPCRRLQ